MEIKEIKQKLRKLKRLELKLLSNSKTSSNSSPIWDSFFDLHEKSKGKAKYSLETLVLMSKEDLKRVIDEYLEFVYNELFKDKAIINYDTKTLIQLGLPFNADEKDIKKRFRELAKQYHPDTGGNAEKFIELMEAYNKLMNK